MIRRPPRSTQSRSSAASDVYKRQGTAGSLAGALIVGLVAAAGQALGWILPEVAAGTLFLILTFAGFCGSLVDSLLGATVQARLRCPACGIVTEQVVHTCGARTVRERGLGWINNDIVNAL